MDNTRFFKTVIIILLIINVSTIGFIFMHHRMPPPGPPDVGRFLMHELDLTPDQHKQFESLQNEHHNMARKIMENSKEVHDSFFSLLKTNPVDSSKINMMADSIIAIQRKMELATFYHFQKVRAICTPEQQEKFDHIINEALGRMAPGPHGR